jgi:hypothetical protein
MNEASDSPLSSKGSGEGGFSTFISSQGVSGYDFGASFGLGKILYGISFGLMLRIDSVRLDLSIGH